MGGFWISMSGIAGERLGRDEAGRPRLNSLDAVGLTAYLCDPFASGGRPEVAAQMRQYLDNGVDSDP
jgi:hypothetical protein